MFSLILKNLNGWARMPALLAPLMMFPEAFMDLQQSALMSK